MLARQTTLRGLDLSRFDFDYDVTWMAFFLDERGRELGRYGGRGPESAEGRSSLAGLRYAMDRALERHKSGKVLAMPEKKGPTIDDYPASKRLPGRACAHCHYAYDFRREARQAEGAWTTDELWVYPLPENLGLEMDNDKGDRVRRVRPGSAAAKAGLKAGDVITKFNDTVVDSGPTLIGEIWTHEPGDKVTLTYERDGRTATAELTLGERKGDS